MAEAVYAFIGYMLESFFDYEDASKYVSRTIPLIANNPGFEEQLKHYATQPQCRNAVIQLETVYDFFPALRPPAGCTEVRDAVPAKHRMHLVGSITSLFLFGVLCVALLVVSA